MSILWLVSGAGLAVAILGLALSFLLAARIDRLISRPIIWSSAGLLMIAGTFGAVRYGLIKGFALVALGIVVVSLEGWWHSRSI